MKRKIIWLVSITFLLIIIGSMLVLYILRPTPILNRYETSGISLRLYSIKKDSTECVYLDTFSGGEAVIEISLELNYVTDSSQFGNVGYKMEGLEGAVDVIDSIRLFVANGDNVTSLNPYLESITPFLFQLSPDIKIKNGTVVKGNCYESLPFFSIDEFIEAYNKKDKKLLGKNRIERVMMLKVNDKLIQLGDSIWIDLYKEGGQIPRNYIKTTSSYRNS